VGHEGAEGGGARPAGDRPADLRSHPGRPDAEGVQGRDERRRSARILEGAKADLGRVVICHTDAKNRHGYLKKIIAMGSYAELDHFGKDFYFTRPISSWIGTWTGSPPFGSSSMPASPGRVLHLAGRVPEDDSVAYWRFRLMPTSWSTSSRRCGAGGIGADAIRTIMQETRKPCST